MCLNWSRFKEEAHSRQKKIVKAKARRTFILSIRAPLWSIRSRKLKRSKRASQRV